MASSRINDAISKLEAALAHIEECDADGAFAPPDERATRAIEDARAAIEERDRTIAKLRADIEDIGRLKDDEIVQLRQRLAKETESTEAATRSAAAGAEAQRRYSRLAEAARATISGLDELIAAGEAHG